MSSVVAIIQARLNSTRLPNKILADLGGRPVLQHVIDRARAIPGVDDVIVAVPDLATQRALAECGMASIATPQVPEANVLARFAVLATQFRSHDAFLRITGDCPFLAPEVASLVLDAYALTQAGYAWNDTTTSGYPDGLDVEVFSRELLMQAHASATDPADLEHVTPWMRRQVITPKTVVNPDPWTGGKLSIDTPADLDRARAIVAKLPKGDYSFAATAKAAKGLR